MFTAFSEVSSEIKDRYEWIYNPPLRADSGAITQGSLDREEFAQHYGGYLEIIYLLTGGDFTKMDEVLEWDIDRFLFQGEYLIRKRIVENTK